MYYHCTNYEKWRHSYSAIDMSKFQRGRRIVGQNAGKRESDSIKSPHIGAEGSQRSSDCQNSIMKAMYQLEIVLHMVD